MNGDVLKTGTTHETEAARGQIPDNAVLLVVLIEVPIAGNFSDE